MQWNPPTNPEDVPAGYGYVANDTTREETFFYHSDHLGSTGYITDKDANITQFDAYLPYGELLVDEHSSSEDLPYKFNGKDLDEETGLYYYGARYMDPVTSLWYGIDPLTEKYASVSGYVYCIGNPIKFIDPDGKKVYQGNMIVIYYEKGKLTVSPKANENTKALFNGMMKTETGRKQLALLVNSPTKIHLIYSHRNTETKTTMTYAETQQATADGSSIRLKNNRYSSTWAKITFFVDMIEKSTKEEGNANFGLSLEEALGVEASHESVHAADPVEVDRDIRSSQPNQKKVPSSTYEKKARQTEQKYRDELSKQKQAETPKDEK